MNEPYDVTTGRTVRADDAQPPAGEAVPEIAEVYIENGARAPEKEYGTNSTITVTPSIDADTTSISGVNVSSGTYSDAFLVATGADSKSTISRATITMGATNVEGGSAGPAVSVGPDASVVLDNVNIVADGSLRYAAYVVETGKLVVKNSVLESTGAAPGDGGSEPASNSPLLIYGMSRTNMSVGESLTYYLNTHVIAEGWAALSTDSATSNGLNLYAYNTNSEAINGGYATYADTDCNVHLYGCTLQSPEIGAIISKSGNINVQSGASVDDTTASFLGTEDATTTDGTVVTGGRNAIMLHAPDMMGEGLRATDTGVLTVNNSTLATDTVLSNNAVTDYAEKYGEAVGAYVEHIMGSTILVKSTSTNITLDSATLESSSDVLIHTVLNNDSMGNFLNENDADDASVDNVNITMSNMSAAGNILHEDYQRYMYLTLNSVNYSGAVVSGTYEDWAALWSEYGDVNWMPDSSWDTINGVYMVLENNSTWTVTGKSTLSSLTVDESSSVIGANGAAVKVTVNGASMSITDIARTKTVTGEIIISLAAK